FMRHDFACRALPDRFSRVAINAQNDELVVVCRLLDIGAAGTKATSTSTGAPTRTFTLFVRTRFVVLKQRESDGAGARGRSRLRRNCRSICFHGGEDKYASSPHDWRRAAAARYRNLPLDVLRGRP